MIALIRGIFLEVTATSIIIETHGIGYKVFIPAHVISNLPQPQQPMTLHTSFVIRENSQALYGFMTAQERDFFETLMDVSGIGPKLALSIVGHISPRELHTAMARNDIRTITKVPGIGKKMAERMIIELRDKISQFSLTTDPSEFAVNIPLDPKAQAIRDAVSALVNLGYTQMVAQKAIKKCMEEHPKDEKIDLPSLITHALKHTG